MMRGTFDALALSLNVIVPKRTKRPHREPIVSSHGDALTCVN